MITIECSFPSGIYRVRVFRVNVRGVPLLIADDAWTQDKVASATAAIIETLTLRSPLMVDPMPPSE